MISSSQWQLLLPFYQRKHPPEAFGDSLFCIITSCSGFFILQMPPLTCAVLLPAFKRSAQTRKPPPPGGHRCSAHAWPYLVVPDGAQDSSIHSKQQFLNTSSGSFHKPMSTVLHFLALWGFSNFFRTAKTPFPSAATFLFISFSRLSARHHPL